MSEALTLLEYQFLCLIIAMSCSLDRRSKDNNNFAEATNIGKGLYF